MTNLRGKRVLLVEDEYFIASDLKRAFVQQGAEVVGPVGDLAGAMQLAEQGDLDAAVLDVNLRGTMSYPIADSLRRHEVPLMFLTGYDGWSMPENYRDVPRAAKPFSMSNVLSIVSSLVHGERTHERPMS